MSTFPDEPENDKSPDQEPASEETATSKGIPAPPPAEASGGRHRRKAGRLKGQITVGPEFFEPLPDDEIALWEGS